MSDHTEQRLKQILVEQCHYSLMIEQIQDHTSLYGKGLGLGSLDVVYLLARLEQEFDIFFEAEEVAPSIETFGTLLGLVQNKLGQGRDILDRHEGS
jgi:acyl carrier protein